MSSDPYLTLARATWHRDFVRDGAHVQRIHKDEVESLRNRLPDALAIAKSQLHPQQSFILKGEQFGVSINERTGDLAICYLNVANAGVLGLQFFDSRGNEVDRDELKLDRFGEDDFVWHAHDSTVTASELATFVVERLIAVAIDIVRDQTPDGGASRFIS